ncbi:MULTISPECIES: peptidase inhibitor family I36 protein [unclassified Streptomyces]|uniref:peptidase inhibitor family I36 protein n=1 Tax=unclassified Streptomyces TaxID=2593676 RepID=UPI0033ADD64B
MNFTRKLSLGLSAAALALAGVGATAPSAAAVGGCPSNTLCLYRGYNYTDLAVTSKSTNICIDVHTWFREQGIHSYVNNLPVKVNVYDWVQETGYRYDATIRSGGFSSNAGTSFGYEGAVCMGSASL